MKETILNNTFVIEKKLGWKHAELERQTLINKKGYANFYITFCTASVFWQKLKIR